MAAAVQSCRMVTNGYNGEREGVSGHEIFYKIMEDGVQKSVWKSLFCDCFVCGNNFLYNECFV